jgi:hypothetical protein
MIELPHEIVSDMLETLRIKLDKEREEFVAEMRREWPETFARLEAEVAAAHAEIKRLRQFERLRVTYEAERDEGSLLQ